MLKAIVVVVDARRGLLPSDQDMESYANSFSIPLIYAFTKTDKLNKSQIRQADEKFVKDHPGQHPVFVSTSDHNCYQILRDVILKAVLKK